MPPAIPISKRLVGTSAALLPEEIETVQLAAHTKRMTMSQFIRGASVREATRVLRRAARQNGRALAKAG